MEGGTTESCPCCGVDMKSEERGTKILFRCPVCGVTDVRMRA